MSLFKRLEEEARKRRLRFLVIGGHAIIEHGVQRGTEDADILVSKDDRGAWAEIVESMGYRLIRDGGTFLQFEPADPSQWDLDVIWRRRAHIAACLRQPDRPVWKARLCLFRVSNT